MDFLFQSTHPVWGATIDNPDEMDEQLISIHAPRVGCDTARNPLVGGSAISIHAPRVGCDADTQGPIR